MNYTLLFTLLLAAGPAIALTLILVVLFLAAEHVGLWPFPRLPWIAIVAAIAAYVFIIPYRRRGNRDPEGNYPLR
jgi:membrane protein implicated in regulation of membrane protease activity